MHPETDLVPAVQQLPATTEAAPAILIPKHVAPVIPLRDYDRWQRLSVAQKSRVARLLEIFAEMEVAPEGIVAASNRLALLNGMSGSQLRTLRSNFKHAGWTALAKIYRGPEKLPEEFVAFVKAEMLRNKKGTRAVIQDLRDAWAQGGRVPGYGDWREWYAVRYPERDIPERFPRVYPEGWSESNLYDKQPTRPQRAIARQGFAAAKRYLPHVVRDTARLRPLELITIDDFELDFLIRAFNPVRRQWEISRCAGLLAIDVATRRKLAVALVPRFRLTRRERDLAEAHIAAHAEIEGEADAAEVRRTRIGITRRDVQSLLHAVFSTFGRPAEYGCTILCENASAAITADFEDALEALLGVQVARTGLLAEKTLRNGFVQGGGRPWEKGWIESLFRTAFNRAGALPGQKGSSYQEKPADAEAKVAYAMKLFESLPAAAVEKLQVPFLTIEEALEGLNAIFARIERRTDHKMIGFEERFLYRLPDGSAEVDERSLALLPQDEVLRCKPIPYAESPVERWQRLMSATRLEQIPESLLACLLLVPKRCKLKDHRITFTLPGRGGFTFADSESPVMKLEDGMELLGYLDPHRQHTLFVTDLKGRYLGMVRRRGAPVDITNPEAIAEEAGEVMKLIRSCVTGEVRRLLAADDRALGEMDAHNVRIQEEAGIARPVRILAQKSLPAAATETTAPGHNGQSPAASAAESSAGAKQPLRPATLSQQLRRAPARDAFKAYEQALAAGIAGAVTQAAASKERAATLQDSGDDLDPSNLLELRHQPAAPAATTTDPDKI